MCGSDERTGSLFSYVDLEARVWKDHPLRTIRLIVNETLAAMERDLAGLYSGTGPTLDRAGEAFAGDAAAGVLLGALGASADGAA